MKDRYNIRISGFGGQGVVLSGFVVGRAASIYEKKYAAFTQSYGPEARGGACSATVVIEKRKIGYPLVKDADFLIVLSKEAYEKYSQKITSDALTFVDSELVSEAPVDGVKVFGIPATRFAEKMGKKIVANIIMLGFFCGVTNILSKDAMKESIKTSVKKSFIELNRKAFDMGYAYADEVSRKQEEGV